MKYTPEQVAKMSPKEREEAMARMREAVPQWARDGEEQYFMRRDAGTLKPVTKAEREKFTQFAPGIED